jgi:hypothetical protein
LFVSLYWSRYSINVTPIAPYLGTTGSVLGGTTGDQLGVPGEEVLIDAHVLLLSENSIVGLQAILLEKSGITRRKVSAIDINKTPPDRKVPAYPRAWMSGESQQSIHFYLKGECITYRGEGSPERAEGILGEQPF